MIKNGDEQVTEDNQRKRAQLENKEENQSDQKNEITGDIHSSELEVLEFQGDHIDWTNQQDGKEDGKHEHHPIIVQHGDMFGCGRNETQEEGVRWCGHPDEVLRLLGVNVETSQTHRRESRHEEDQVGT